MKFMKFKKKDHSKPTNLRMTLSQRTLFRDDYRSSTYFDRVMRYLHQQQYHFAPIQVSHRLNVLEIYLKMIHMKIQILNILFNE